MSYIVFGLGILLSAAGSFAIYAGFDIIQVERGWTEVIAGTTALTGGVVTISLALVLHRIGSIAKLFAASPVQPVAAAPIIAAPAPLSMPEPLPHLDPVKEEPAPARTVAAPSQIPIPAPIQVSMPVLVPAPAAVPVSDPLPVSALEPAPSAQFDDEPFTDETFEDETFREMSQSFTAALETPSEAALASQASVEVEEAYQPQAEPEPTLSLSTRASAPALSFDEMWKRVSDEIEKPLFAPRSQTPISQPAGTHTPPPPQAESDMFEDLITVEALSHLSRERHDPPLHEDADAQRMPQSGSFDWDAQIDDAAARSQPAQPSLIDDLGTSYREAPEPGRPAQDRRINQQTSFTGTAATIESPVIGSYESDATAYVMFADGSIEARSEAGIFRFASMADLRAFIESNQAVAS